MKLSAITTGQFQNYAPTPVENYAIKTYLTADKLLNIMEWESMGMGTGIGNLVASVLSYDTPPDAKGRKIGENFEPDNQVATPTYITLKALGGSFEADIINKLAFSNSPGAVDNWVESQIALKLDGLKRTFAKWFLGGDSETDDHQFDGMGKYFKKFPNQVNENALELNGGLTQANALSVQAYFNEAISAMTETPNVIITTKRGGAPMLATLEQAMHSGIMRVKIGDNEYDHFMGIPVVGLPEELWPADMLAKGTPFLFAKLAERNGIRCMLPINVGSSISSIIHIVRPNFETTGKAVNEGYVQMLTALAAVDPYAAALCYVKQGAAGGNA